MLLEMTRPHPRAKMFVLAYDELNEVLSKIGARTEDRDGEIVILDEGKQVTCEVCHSKLTTENVGHIEKGSKRFYCDKPACFSHFVNRRKLWR